MFKAEHSQIRAEHLTRTSKVFAVHSWCYSTMAELTVTYLSLSACKESRAHQNIFWAT